MQLDQNCLYKALLTFVFSFLLLSTVHAGKPMWTFEPLTATTLTVNSGEMAEVRYTVQNQSARPKTLVMKAIPGINQAAPCQLAPKGSCTLVLTINGSTLVGSVVGGPMLCEQGNNLQCYQPNAANILRITRPQPPVQQLTVTPLAGANGTIAPAVPQVVNRGSSLLFTATPNMGYGVNQWLLDGSLVQTGGTSYQLNNIQANHVLQVTFSQATLTPFAQNLVLSVDDTVSDPALTGNPRVIRITNQGSTAATNLQVGIGANPLPLGTTISNNTCTGTLNVNDTCTITITPGSNASLNALSVACNTAPGTEAVPSIVSISADNAPTTDINVYVLNFACIYQAGYVFAIDDSTASKPSIGGKLAALVDQSTATQWGPQIEVGGINFNSMAGHNSCDGKNDGACDTLRIINANLTPPPIAAQLCVDYSSQGYSDWYMPAICELSRFLGNGDPVDCPTDNPNVYVNLQSNGSGNFQSADYWSSTEYAPNPTDLAKFQNFTVPNGIMGEAVKTNDTINLRCIRPITF